MRVTRAYVAGFGTAGSLVAGVSVLFVLASAVVSFRGWPQVADAGPSPALVLSNAPQYGVTRRISKLSGRRVHISSARRTTSVAPPRADTRPAASVVHRQASPQTTIVGTPHGHSTPPVLPKTTATTTPITTSTPPPACASGCGGSPASTPGLGGVAASATGALGAGVTATGKQVASTVSQVSGALASSLSTASPVVGGLVANVGQALGALVGQLTGATGNTVTGGGQLLGGILGGASH